MPRLLIALTLLVYPAAPMAEDIVTLPTRGGVTQSHLLSAPEVGKAQAVAILFPGGPGKTSSPADFASLMDDLQHRVFDVLPDDTWVYPGHGDDTVLAAERPHLNEWRSRGW